MRPWTKRLAYGVLIMSLAVCCVGQARKPDCAEMRYENRNQTDYGPLVLAKVAGVALDPDGVSVPDVCVGVFTAEDHRLVASTRTDGRGSFQLKGISRGDYRLVAKCDGFCSGNAKIRVEPKTKSKKQLKLEMRFAGIDTCSFFEIK